MPEGELTLQQSQSLFAPGRKRSWPVRKMGSESTRLDTVGISMLEVGAEAGTQGRVPGGSTRTGRICQETSGSDDELVLWGVCIHGEGVQCMYV